MVDQISFRYDKMRLTIHSLTHFLIHLFLSIKSYDSHHTL